MAVQQIRTMAKVEQWLFLDLPSAPREYLKTSMKFERGRHFMKLLGNPQDSYKSIHIAGTSGKGSTAYMIAGLLQAASKTVGLHVSPHVYDFRERMQVNGKLVSEAELCHQVNFIKPIVESMSIGQYGSPTYFEVSIALAHLIFRDNTVDYGVVETGLGGLYDVSNLISKPDKLSVINQIGLDHTATLGKTIKEIATQKAGIMLPGSHAIALWQSAAARASFEQQAQTVGAELEYVDPVKVTQLRSADINGSAFDLKLGSWDWAGLRLGAAGDYQVTNAALALRAVQYLGERDEWHLSRSQVAPVLKNLQLPGRFEVHQVGDKLLILDSAHNPQKLAALTGTLRQLFLGQKFTFILAMSQPRSVAELLEPLVPLADRIVLGQFNTQTVHKLLPPTRLARQLEKLGFTNYEITTGSNDALALALESPSNVIVATSSLYFLGQIKNSIEKIAFQYA